MTPCCSSASAPCTRTASAPTGLAACGRRCQGVRAPRCRVERLMRRHGICGAQPGRKRRWLTVADEAAARPADLVERRFVAERANELWVCDLTFLKTREGFAYLAFVLDVFSRMIVGWQTATHLTRFRRPGDGGPPSPTGRREPVAHIGRGSEYTSFRYTQRLADLGIAASVGSVADAYDAGAMVRTARRTPDPSRRLSAGPASRLGGAHRAPARATPAVTRRVRRYDRFLTRAFAGRGRTLAERPGPGAWRSCARLVSHVSPPQRPWPRSPRPSSSRSRDSRRTSAGCDGRGAITARTAMRGRRGSSQRRALVRSRARRPGPRAARSGRGRQRGPGVPRQRPVRRR